MGGHEAKAGKRVTECAVDVTLADDDVTEADRRLPDDILNGIVSAIENGYAAKEGLAEETLWTREMVMDRLEAAIRLVHATAGRVGPRGYGSSMPAYLYSELDLWYQATQTAEERRLGDNARNRTRRPATREEIRQADEALQWPTRYVEHEVVRQGLHLWMLSRALRTPFNRVLKVRGIAQRTGIHRRDRAVALVVYGLTLEGART